MGGQKNVADTGLATAGNLVAWPLCRIVFLKAVLDSEVET